ncbi:MAG: AAA family ATPase [Pseudomonadota bacterium]
MSELNTGGMTRHGDQAAGLRRLFGAQPPQVVAFASGHGACGRTTLVVQTAAALAAAGHGVVIIDENAAPNNAVASFGLAARYDLMHALSGERSLRQVMLQAAPLVRILPAARAAHELDSLAAADEMHLAACLNELQRGASFVLIDCAVRRQGRLSRLAAAARHMAVVVAAHGNSITHAYALIKHMAQERGRGGFQIVITRARSDEEAHAIFDNMRRVARGHLDVRLDYLGAADVPVTANLAAALTDRLPPAFGDTDAGAGGFLLGSNAPERGGWPARALRDSVL